MNIILKPFIWIVGGIYHAMAWMFVDPAWAVIATSGVISLGLLPIFLWMERRKALAARRNAPMMAEIGKINSVYKGRERYFYTREIHRRYGYKQTSSLLPMLGLLIQIPLLLAAYNYILEEPIFERAAWLYIQPLSNPDVVAYIGHFPVAVLPFVMTILNLIAAWRYADENSVGEKVQYIGVALLFLVLLYKCPAAVVLYWTAGNGFAILRGEYLRTYRASLAGTISPEEGTRRQMRLTAGVLFGVGLFAAIAASMAMLDNVCAMVCYKKSMDFLPPYWLKFGTLAVVLLVISGIFHLRLRGHSAQPSPIPKIAAFWFVLPTVCWTVQITLCGPVSVFASYPNGAPDLEFGLLIAYGVAATVAMGAAAWLLWRFLPVRARYVVFSVLLAVFFVTFSYSSFVDTNYGLFHQGAYMNPDRLARAFTPGPLVGEFYAVAALVTFVILVARPLVACVRPAKYAFSILLLTLLARTAVASFRSADFIIDAARARQDSQASASYFFSYSTTTNNVLILLLDTSSGAFIPQILDNNPQLRDALDGFTFHRHTYAFSIDTYPNIPAILGGEEFQPAKVEQMGRLMPEVIDVAWKKFAANAKRENQRFIADRLYRTKWGIHPDECDATYGDRDMNSHFTLLADNGADSDILRFHTAIALRGNALLHSLPFALRPVIYNESFWSIDHADRDPMPAHNFLKILPQISTVAPDDRGLTLYLHSWATHMPPMTPVDNHLKGLGLASSMEWALLRVAEYLEWMKTNGVYDNTRIVIMSDHGLRFENLDNTPENRVSAYIREVMHGRPANSIFAMLFTKDYNERHPLVFSSVPKTVAHGAYFAFDDPRFSAPLTGIDYVDMLAKEAVDNWTQRTNFNSRNIYHWSWIGTNLLDPAAWHIDSITPGTHQGGGIALQENESDSE